VSKYDRPGRRFAGSRGFEIQEPGKRTYGIRERGAVNDTRSKRREVRRSVPNRSAPVVETDRRWSILKIARRPALQEGGELRAK